MNTSRQRGICSDGEMGVGAQREREREKDKDKQDCKIVIIGHTNEKLITPQLTMSRLYYLRLDVGGTMQHW